MRFVLMLLMLLLIAEAKQQVEIAARTFSSDEKAGKTVFTGDVVITRGSDVMKADRITVFSTPEREVTRFEAIGNTFFDVTTDDNHHFKGRANELVYLPVEGLYTLTGAAEVEDLTEKRKISGEHIVLNELTKMANVTGGESEPVKIIFTLKDRNESAEANRTQGP